ELLEEFTYKHPEVQALNKKISMIKHKIYSNINNLKKSIYQKSKELKKIKRLHNIKLKTLPVKERKLINMKRDYEVSSTMYNFLLKRKAENDIVRVSTLSDYRVIDKAYASNIPIGSNQINILITYITIGLIVAFVFLSFKEKGKIKSINNLKKELDIPIYGVLFSKKNVINWDEYINLRTNLKLKLNKKIQYRTGNILLISSSLEKEDKNITIVNLATIFQRSGDKVVIVDLDMRNPILHKILKINNINSDISSYLGGNIKSIEDITYSTIHKNLDIIPIKNRPSNPSELILSIYLSKLFEVLKDRYDYILVNTTPFNIIKDFRYIIKFSDINLFLFKEYCTQQKSILELKEIIEQDEIDKIGAIWMENNNFK
ncbi:MAG: AAA family ATPase, partial [Sulfurovaceae bacterium]|nr:AAA family ATPase [Sulfurovaceae bacterium]